VIRSFANTCLVIFSARICADRLARERALTPCWIHGGRVASPADSSPSLPSSAIVPMIAHGMTAADGPFIPGTFAPQRRPGTDRLMRAVERRTDGQTDGRTDGRTDRPTRIVIFRGALKVQSSFNPRFYTGRKVETRFRCDAIGDRPRAAERGAVEEA